MTVPRQRPGAERTSSSQGQVEFLDRDSVAAKTDQDDEERRRRWRTASLDAAQRLFTGAAQPPLTQVLPCALEAAAGHLAALALVDGGVLEVTCASGPLADIAKAQVLCDELVPGPQLLAGESVLVDVPPVPGAPADPAARVGSLMAAPLRVDGEIIAVVVVGRSSAAPRLDPVDLKQFRGFARNLGIAVELDRARTGLETLRLFEERDRIAADLHDHVIQELFAVGMGLQGMLHGLPADQQERVAGYVDEIDAAIAGIRGTIFGLHHADRASAGLQERLLAVLDKERQVLGFPVPVEFFGPLDSGLPAQLSDDVVDVVREALSDVARRGGASGAHVLVTIADGVLTVDVIDDGHGSPSTSWSGGSRSLRRRAEHHGGILRVSASPGGGTHLHWSACVPG